MRQENRERLRECGNPVQGANVSIRDDEGETWSLSTQTTEDGTYTLRFYPFGGSSYILRLAVGSDSYEYPEEVSFSDETSATMDIVLGTHHGGIMGTGPDGEFEIKDVPGAEYVGHLAGAALGDEPIMDAVVTWPDESGNFTITLPSLQAGQEVSFFQHRVRFYSEEMLTPGGDIPLDEVITSPLDVAIPRDIPPFITVS